jgi:hypothetical protein
MTCRPHAHPVTVFHPGTGDSDPSVFLIADAGLSLIEA